MPRISKRVIDAMIENGDCSIVWDEELQGFGARLNGNGTISYLVQYRTGRGRGFPSRRMVLGRHGRLTPDQARQLARETLADATKAIEKGQAHPAARRAAHKKERTVADLLEYAIEHHWKAKGRKSANAFEAMIRRTLVPEFGSKKLSDLRRFDITDWHARQIHRPRQANLDLALLRKALAIAVANEWLDRNPAQGIDKHPEKQRDRTLSNDELRALWIAFDVAPIRPSASLLFKLLMLTGCRTGEWCNALWADVDWQNQLLRLRDAKAGKRDVPLNPAVLNLLNAADRSTHFIIPSDTGEKPLTKSNVRDAWAKVVAEAKISDLHVHDLRHTFATYGAALGANALILRDTLGHKTLAMTGRYVAKQTDPVRELSNRISGQLLGIVAGKTAEITRL